MLNIQNMHIVVIAIVVITTTYYLWHVDVAKCVYLCLLCCGLVNNYKYTNVHMHVKTTTKTRIIKCLIKINKFLIYLSRLIFFDFQKKNWFCNFLYFYFCILTFFLYFFYVLFLYNQQTKSPMCCFNVVPKLVMTKFFYQKVRKGNFI